jgi:hypothetical protein
MNDATQFFNTVAGAGGYEIERSLRFNSSDSAYLSKNFPALRATGRRGPGRGG